MRYAADLHLHSRHAEAVSPQMTLETFARMARRKGIDVMGTGDCLQPEWLEELEKKLVPADAAPGWWRLREEIDEPALAGLPEGLRKALHLVLSTEVHCAPRGTRELEGIHHLLWFPSFGAARRFQQKARKWGNLREGRPRLEVSSRELLGVARECGEGIRMAPAHVMNPYFSTLGSVMKRRTLAEEFGTGAGELLAVEMGLTSIPPMCRRMASLDGHALFACSDAHSPENLGREVTILETEPGFEPMLAAIGRGSREEVIGCVKYSIHRTRYFLNWCARCKAPWDAEICPRGHDRLVTGSRDYLERIANRPSPDPNVAGTPRFRMYVPLRELLMEYYRARSATKAVLDIQERLLREVGNELQVLTKASEGEIAEAAGAGLAAQIAAQRGVDWRERIVIKAEPKAQPELF